MSWPDWTIWDEVWVPALVYCVVAIAAVGLLGRIARVRRLLRPALVTLTLSPLLTVGSTVVVAGAAASLKSGSDFARVATVVCGTVMLLAYYLLPRLIGFKWRDLEILLSEAEKARSEGDEERADEVLRTAAMRLREQPAPETGASQESTSAAGAAILKRWLAAEGDRPAASIGAPDSYLQFEDRALRALQAAESGEAVRRVNRRSWDAEVRLGPQHRVAVDIRAGLKFSSRDVLRRMAGEFFLLDETERPIAYLLVVRSPSGDSRLEVARQQFQGASFPAQLVIVGLTDEATEDEDVEILRSALRAIRTVHGLQ